MTKLDGHEVLRQAEQAGQIYPIKSGWKKYMIFTGVVLCLLILTIPLGIWFFLIAGKARLGITDEGFALKWFTTQAYRWDEIAEFQPISMQFYAGGGGLIGGLVAAAASSAVAAKTEGLKGPIRFKRKGKRGWRQIPAQAIQSSVVMAREMEARTGLNILPPEQPA